jgi:hypothetical protein
MVKKRQGRWHVPPAFNVGGWGVIGTMILPP